MTKLFHEIRGLYLPKRALEIALVQGHRTLLCANAHQGKTALRTAVQRMAGAVGLSDHTFVDECRPEALPPDISLYQITIVFSDLAPADRSLPPATDTESDVIARVRSARTSLGRYDSNEDAVAVSIAALAASAAVLPSHRREAFALRHPDNA